MGGRRTFGHGDEPPAPRAMTDADLGLLEPRDAAYWKASPEAKREPHIYTRAQDPKPAGLFPLMTIPGEPVANPLDGTRLWDNSDD